MPLRNIASSGGMSELGLGARAIPAQTAVKSQQSGRRVSAALHPGLRAACAVAGNVGGRRVLRRPV
jgi:hypothetical protein